VAAAGWGLVAHRRSRFSGLVVVGHLKIVAHCVTDQVQLRQDVSTLAEMGALQIRCAMV
jgi:hypothetical protein